jgi:hypothetical protein
LLQILVRPAVGEQPRHISAVGQLVPCVVQAATEGFEESALKLVAEAASSRCFVCRSRSTM